MALMQRYLRSQFLNSQIGRPTLVSGQFTIAAPVAATLVDQGVTLTAALAGDSGNDITYEITAGAVAGAEVVTVVGNAISIQIESGVSSITDVVTALLASAPATALAVASGAGAAVVNAPLAPTNLSGGDSGIGSNNFGELVSSVALTGVGEYTITLADNYSMANFVGCKLMAAVAVDLIPQLKSSDVVVAKTVVVTFLAGATPTDVAANASLLVEMILNQSSLYY